MEFRAQIINANSDGSNRIPLGDFPENIRITEDVVSVLNHMNDTTVTVVTVVDIPVKTQRYRLFYSVLKQHGQHY